MSTDPAPRPRLLFVYNADSGFRAALFDSVHKLVSPGTYACSLCALTYGPLSMRRAWRDWLRSAPFDARFVHRDELARDYPGFATPLPAVVIESEAEPHVLIGPATLDSLASIDALIAHIERALGEVPD